MKLNKKIIAPALTLLAGASLAGSVTGTIAWYQYSTRANVSYIGSSAGVIGNLQVKLATDDDSKWGPQVRTEDVLDYLRTSGYGQAVEPVTPGALEKNDFLKELEFDSGVDIAHGDAAALAAILNPTEGQYFVKVTDEVDPLNPTGPHLISYDLLKYAPIDIDDAAPWKDSSDITINPNDDEKAAHLNDANYQYISTDDFKVYSKQVGNDKQFYLNPTFGNDSYNKWIKAEAKHYVKIPLQLRFVGNNESDLKAKDIYLSKLLIQRDRQSNPNDISDAIRVHFSAYEDGDEIHAINHLVSKNGGTIATEGRLRLGRGADFDKAYVDEDDVWGFNEGNEYKYVQYGKGSQNSYGSRTDVADYYDGYHNYYEADNSTATSKPWKNIPLDLETPISVTVGTLDKTADDGNPGDLYIKQVDADTRKLFEKKPDLWKVVDDDSIVQYGTVLPSTDLGCLYYIRSYNDAFYAIYKYEAGVWAVDQSFSNYNSEEPVALGELRLDTANQKLMRGEKDGWAEVDSSKYEFLKEVDLTEKPLTEKADGYVKGKYYIDSNDKLYEFDGGIYKEKISPVLVKESTDPNTPLLLEDLNNDKVIAKTTEGHVVNVDVTIWVEGWQKFEKAGKFSSIWESGYIQSMFDVGMQFAVQDLRA